MQNEASRQIGEFEELVARLDRINNKNVDNMVEKHVGTVDFSTGIIAGGSCPTLENSEHSRYVRESDNFRTRSLQGNDEGVGIDDKRNVRVHLGIDDDLRMILEMDPSIVDQTPPTAILRDTRPHGWYWTAHLI